MNVLSIVKLLSR